MNLNKILMLFLIGISSGSVTHSMFYIDKTIRPYDRSHPFAIETKNGTRLWITIEKELETSSFVRYNAHLFHHTLHELPVLKGYATFYHDKDTFEGRINEIVIHSENRS